MMLALDQPWLLLVAAAVAATVVVAGRRALDGSRQQRAATWVRAAALSLLVLALAGPRWQTGGGGVDVAFLVDASDSLGASGQADALAWIRSATATKPGDDRAGLAQFGADARLDRPLTADASFLEVTTVVDGSATDIGRALRLAQGMLGSERRRRAVLLTDGRQTDGDAVRAARELAEGGVDVDVVPLAASAAADVLIEGVDAPDRVREGEAYDVEVTVGNTGGAARDVVVVLTTDGEEVARETVVAAPGSNSLRVGRVAGQSGTVRYEAHLEGGSAVAANDVGRASVHVAGPASVLVVEGRRDAGRELAAALEAAAVPADRVPASRLPALDRLLEVESVVLVDVPADALGDDGQATLDAFVRDAGHGLVAVGGEQSFGLGDYDGTPLEELLPVFARVTDPERRLSVAEALVVDVSGSMAACHCQDGGFGGQGGLGGGSPVEGGVNKTDISREAVARAVEALDAQDTVGVLAFNTDSEWVIPLQQLPPQAIVDDGLARLHPQGGTSVPAAVREAIAGLRDVEARLRHIVLFTDGFTEEEALVDVAAEAAEAGITLSVVGTGEGAGQVLEEMAAAGGGRYYPGRDLLSIPDIVVNEVQLVARPVVQEGRFFPAVTGLAPATEDLEASPPLLGYLATTPKPTARTLLALGDERDPLLATWQAGLGTAVAWTSDTSPRWSAEWLTWDRFAAFWSDVVRATFPPDADPGVDVDATATRRGLRVEVEAADPLPVDARASATVTSPDGDRTPVELERTSLTNYAADLPGGREGVYAVSVRVERPGSDGPQVLFQDTVATIRSYSPEYAFGGGTDAGLVERIAAAGNGRVDPAPDSAFDPGGLEPGSASRSFAWWFTLVGLVLLPVDVGLRRLRLEREDWPRLKRWIRARLRRDRGGPAEDGPPPGATADLLAARRRGRERRGG